MKTPHQNGHARRMIVLLVITSLALTTATIAAPAAQPNADSTPFTAASAKKTAKKALKAARKALTTGRKAQRAARRVNNRFPVGTADLADGSVTAAKLADGLVGEQGPRGPRGPQGEAGEALARAAHTAAADLDDTAVFVGGAVGNALSVQIAVPTAGTLVISGGTDAETPADAVPEAFTCGLRIGGTDIVGTERYVPIQDFSPGAHCQTSGAVDVAAGTHTVRLRLSRSSTAIDFFAASLQVTFTPAA